MIKHWYDVLEKVQSRVSDDGKSDIGSGSLKPVIHTGVFVHTLEGTVFDKKRYYYDSSAPDVYLTCREAQCVYYLLHGYTMVKTADILDLSPRTIEFYVKNIKMKLNLVTKSELIAYMMKVNFLDCINQS